MIRVCDNRLKNNRETSDLSMFGNKDKYTQILVTFTKEQVKQIENYWHENKLKNRNEAIRQIVDKGLSRK